MSLRERVCGVGFANTFDFFKQGIIGNHCTPQVSPVTPFPTQNNVVDGSKRKLLVVQVAVFHALF
jgi:hypothetical protein